MGIIKSSVALSVLLYVIYDYPFGIVKVFINMIANILVTAYNRIQPISNIIN
jgi:hypothetical protein